MNLKNLNINEFIAIDVETTGLDVYHDKIIEIAAVKFKNGKIEDLFTELINPNQKIPRFIENLTGICNVDVLDKPSFNEISNDFIRFIDKYPIIGHSVSFDIDFINKELNGSYDIYNNEFICDTYQLSKIFLYDQYSYKLQSLCDHFSININKAHRAKEDAENSGILFIKLIDIISSCSLDNFNNIYKIYSDKIILNKILFENCIKYFIDNSILRIKERSDKKNSYSNISKKEKTKQNLNLEDIFSKGGLLSKKIKNYEFRSSQNQFSNQVRDSIDNNDILIAEAEAGLGKTYGYLIPSILYAGQKIIVSTSTHNLQEQLFNKDIPNIAEILNVPIKATIIKGMRNYICKSRLEHLINNIDILNDDERLDLLSLIVWIDDTNTGDISECNGFKIWKSKKIWDLVCYNHEFCGINKSNNHDECYYQKLKNSADKSNLLIINHALLASCYEKQDSIITGNNICIIDEAHKLSENCRMYLKESLNKQFFQGIFESYSYMITKILNNNKNHKGYNMIYDSNQNIINEFSIFLKIFQDMSYSFANSKLTNNNSYGNVQDIRYKCTERQLIDINPNFEAILDSFKKLLILLIENNDLIKNTNYDNYSKVEKIDLTITLNKIIDTQITIKKIFSDNSNYVNWISIISYNDNINSITFNIAPLWVHNIFTDLSQQFDSMILTSATLTVDDSFDYILQEIGLDNYIIDKKVITKKYRSPFLINDQIRIFVNDSNYNIKSMDFIESTYRLITNLKENMNKRMLVLCTSYKQISDFKSIYDNNSNIIFQDQSSSKQILLNKYFKHKDSVLFGTSSFWEGVDLPDDKLEILVIIKVPFSNPYNPIVQAKIDTYIEKQLDPFMDYQLSEAILKLKQGIGRLIRQKNDTGICILADPRILKKRYGEAILDSLPTNYIKYKHFSTILYETEKFLGT